MKFDLLYLRFPIFAQNALCSLYGFRLNQRRYNQKYRALEQEIFSREFFSPAEIKEYSGRRLRSIIGYAVEKVPFYRKLFASYGLKAKDIREPGDLSLLPILEKSTVQSQLYEFYSEELLRMPYSMVHTSGTTGAGLIFPITLTAEQEQWGVWWRYRARFGIDRYTWYAHFYGKNIVPLSQNSPPFCRVNWPGHQVLFSAYHMSDSYLYHYVEELKRRQLPWIQGYPSLLAIVATYIMESGNALHYQPRIITSGAESLLPQQKEIIEKAFGAPCRQHYGMAEGVANVSECPKGNLHVDEDYACIEFLPIEGNTCRIIGTGFTNTAFPLIRYDTGDVAELYDADYTCPCGRAGRLVKSIDGRIEDYIVTPDGRRIGRISSIFKGMINIKECQLYQDTPEKVIFRIVRGMNYSDKDEHRILSEARKRLGDSIDIEVSYVTGIEKTKTGKLRFVISKIPASKIIRTVKDTS